MPVTFDEGGKNKERGRFRNHPRSRASYDIIWPKEVAGSLSGVVRSTRSKMVGRGKSFRANFYGKIPLRQTAKSKRVEKEILLLGMGR